MATPDEKSYSSAPIVTLNHQNKQAELAVADRSFSGRFGFKTALNEIVRHRNAYYMGLAASFGGTCFGFETGLIGGVLAKPAFQKSFGLDDGPNAAGELADLKGNIVAVLQAGAFFGAISGLWIPSKWGRKPAMIFSAVIFLIGSVIQTVCCLGGQSVTSARNQLYVGRVIGGFGVGLSSAVIPTYISECSPRAIRGRVSGMYQLLNVSGIMLSFFINYGLNIQYASDNTNPVIWQIAFALQCMPGVLFLVLMIFQPESPRHSVEHGKFDEAKRSISRLYNISLQEAEGVTNEIRDDLLNQSNLGLVSQVKHSFKSKATLYRVSTGFIIMFFQQWSGVNSINYYSPSIFQSLGITGGNSDLLATGIYGVVKVVTTALFLVCAIEQLGRKWCFIIGSLGQSLCLFYVAGFQGIAGENPGKSGAGYFAIVCIYGYVVFYGLGLSSTAWAVSSEVAPNHLRSLAMALAASSQWLFNFVIAKLTPILLEEIKWGTFLLFGLVTLFAVLWAVFFLPETSGVTLEAIGKSYEGDLISRSVADLFPSKRRAYRARMLLENGTTADDGGFVQNLNGKDQIDYNMDDQEKIGKKDSHNDQVVYQVRDADRND